MHPFSLWSSPTICWSTCCMTLGTCVFNHVKLTVRTNCYKKHHIKKATEISKKFSEWKQAPHVGMVGLIPQHFHATPTSCAILPMHTKKLSSLFIHTKWTRYSALLTPESSVDPDLPCSNFTTLPQFLHTGKTDHICHAQYNNYVVHCSNPQHNSLPMHALPASHNRPLHTTNKQSIFVTVSGSKIAQM